MRDLLSEKDFQDLIDEILARIEGDVNLRKYEYKIEDFSDAFGPGPGALSVRVKITMETQSSSADAFAHDKVNDILSDLGLDVDELVDWDYEGNNRYSQVFVSQSRSPGVGKRLTPSGRCSGG